MNRKTLRNGVWTGSGLGVSYRYSGGVLYLETENGDEYRWTGSKWELHLEFDVDCEMSDWSLTGEVLSVTPCIDGVQTRTERFTRTIITQPQHGGLACGPLTEDREFEQACEAHEDSPNNTRITAGSGSIWFGGKEYTIIGVSIYEDAPELYADGGWAIQALLHDDVIYVKQPPSPGNSHWYHRGGSPQTWIDDGLDDPETGTPPVLLTLATNGTGAGTVSGGGSYTPGATVVLTASPGIGSNSAGWGPSPCAPSFVMPGSPLTCTHTFNESEGPPPTPPPGGLLRSIITTGTINIASNPRRLTVASATGILQGDWIIVGTGKEPGQGLRGTRGVGGNWPWTSYPTYAAMNAATFQPVGRYAWTEPDGLVYRKVSGGWQLFGNSPDDFYLSAAIPLALNAIVSSISGNVLTLDRDAQVSVTNADVFVDMAPVISTMPSGIILPQGWFPVGGCLRRVAGGSLIGQGQSLTRLFSPDGCPSQQFQHNADGIIIEDLTLQGNFKEKGWMMNRTTSTAACFNQPITEDVIPQLGTFPHAIALTGGATNARIRRVTFIDPATALWDQANGMLAEDCNTIMTVGHAAYIQWLYNAVNSAIGSIFRRCNVDSPRMQPGWEAAFGATQVRFENCTGRNGTASVNAASAIYIDFTQVFTAGCNVSQRGQLSGNNQALLINTNAGTQSSGAGSQSIRQTITIEGNTNANGSNLIGLVVGHDNVNVIIDGLRYNAVGLLGQAWSSDANNAICKNGVVSCLNNHTATGIPNKAPYYGRGSHYGNCTGNIFNGAPAVPNSSIVCYSTWP